MTTLEQKNTSTDGAEKKNKSANAVGKTAFCIEKDTLLSALLLCAKIVPKSSSVPLLQCIKFDLKQGKLFITAMDAPAQAVLQMLPVEDVGGIDGSYCVNAKETVDLIRKVPQGELSFTQQDSVVTVKYGRGKAILKVLNSDEYPSLPKPANSNFLTCPIEVLSKGANAVNFACTDDKAPALKSVYIYNMNGKLAFMSTDRHRIYRYISEITIEDPDNFLSGLIPALEFSKIINSLKSASVDLAISGKYLVLRDKNAVYFGTLIEAEFPDLQKIFNRSQIGSTVTVNRSEFEDTLNRMLSLERVANNRVTLEVNEDGVFTVHSESHTGEICESFPDAKIDGDFPCIKLNGKFLLDASLSGERAKKIILRTAGIGHPAFIEFGEDLSLLNIVNQLR